MTELHRDTDDVASDLESRSVREAKAGRYSWADTLAEAAQHIRALEAENDELLKDRARLEKLEQCLAFFRSVVLGGESWSPTCQDMYDAAMKEPTP
jgi:hypothetical protein